MKPIISLTSVRAELETDVNYFMKRGRSMFSSKHDTLGDGVSHLSSVRKELYEDLNQLQHRYLALTAMEYLEANQTNTQSISWSWHPTSTGPANEPDILGVVDKGTALLGEVTSSPKPIGSIDKRMAATLGNLSKMDGKKYYFVRTDVMAKRARTKVEKAGYDIEVVTLGFQSQ